MNLNVSSSIFLLTSLGRFSSPYNKSCARTSFERLAYPNGRNSGRISARRFCRWTTKDGQSNKKCSVSSTPSFVGHIGFIVSLKLCLNLWKFNLLRPTLSWVRCDNPIGSWIPKTDFAGGRIIDKSFFLKTVTDGASLISGSSSFHSVRQLGWKLDLNFSVLALIRPMTSGLRRV